MFPKTFSAKVAERMAIWGFMLAFLAILYAATAEIESGQMTQLAAERQRATTAAMAHANASGDKSQAETLIGAIEAINAKQAEYSANHRQNKILLVLLTLVIVVMRLVYRATRSMPEWRLRAHRRPVLHWTLYGVVILVPLLGWAGISDFGVREIFPGYSLPPIWPEGAGYDALLLQYHAYLAFALLALVALHIGVAIQDYMTDRHLDDE